MFPSCAPSDFPSVIPYSVALTISGTVGSKVLDFSLSKRGRWKQYFHRKHGVKFYKAVQRHVPGGCSLQIKIHHYFNEVIKFL